MLAATVVKTKLTALAPLTALTTITDHGRRRFLVDLTDRNW
jgi:hypothetical protein